VCGSMMLKPWRGAPVAIDRTALFLDTILIAAIDNCSGSGWREHGVQRKKAMVMGELVVALKL
jgi:hypothetical protein